MYVDFGFILITMRKIIVYKAFQMKLHRYMTNMYFGY